MSVALLVIATLAMTAGLILDGIRKARHEFSRLKYLDHAAVAAPMGSAAMRDRMVPGQRVTRFEGIAAVVTAELAFDEVGVPGS